MTFAEALNAIAEGKEVTRTGWNAQKLGNVPMRLVRFPECQTTVPDGGTMTLGSHLVLILGERHGDQHGSPWLPSTKDMRADDWAIVE